ncbi:MAG TPA: hypothetical protein PLT00_06630 [Verrucomicrobiota bacterium]|nr:MAG: hypothetical protein BWX84_01338 [Verrucomicrobia bacterium ADurb.Bin118]HPY32112.1 hypothetical protein [Verrucomicrobiota bacterium]HQB16372.1 hypothetical protein [Verrucomicrobiota bacterium]
MKKTLILAACCLAATFAYASPIPSGKLKLITQVNPSADLSLQPGSMFNPRYADGDIYANQIGAIGVACFGRYPSGGGTATLLVNPPSHEFRMVIPFRGAYANTYLLCSGGTDWGGNNYNTFTRLDYNHNEYSSYAEVQFVDDQLVEGFDWADDENIICTDYLGGNRNRLYLAKVTADPFEITPNTRWNANAYVTTSITGRIRNVRTGMGEGYSDYAYYGDNQVAASPKVFALNLETGLETELGSWSGDLKAGTAGGAATGSWGLWTVVACDGYIYLQSSDDGIQVFKMNSPTSMGDLVTWYTKEELDEVTGGTPAHYGFDVTPDGKRMILGSYAMGPIFELGWKDAPYEAEELQLRAAMEMSQDLGTAIPTTLFNPRFFDGYAFVNQINTFGFGIYPSGSATPKLVVDNAGIIEHRMITPFRGAYRSTYLLGSSQAAAPGNNYFSRYDFDGGNRVDVSTPSGNVAAGFDWVDDDTIIYVAYNPSGDRKNLYLVDVVAEPFQLTANTTWNANGYAPTSVSGRIRNVRVGDVYNGYAYYGDAGVNDHPNFYALDLATGQETLLGNAGTLTGGGSFGIWTVLERGGFLYVQTTDNGIQVYSMVDATTLGSLFATYSHDLLKTITGYTREQFWGLDVTPDGRRLLLAGTGTAYEFGPPNIFISLSGSDLELSWYKFVTGGIVQASDSIIAPDFKDLDPQPYIFEDGNVNKAVVPLGAESKFYRLRK